MNRDELIQLSDEGKIKYKKKFLKEADDETIEKISNEYVKKQLDATNEQLADMIVGKFSDLLKQTEMVDKECDLKKERSKNKMFKNDLKSFVGCVTPYLPYIGLISGLLTVGGYVVYKRSKTKGTEEPPEEDEVRRDQKVQPEEPEEDEVRRDQKVQTEPPKEPKARKPRAPRKPRASKEREETEDAKLPPKEAERSEAPNEPGE